MSFRLIVWDPIDRTILTRANAWHVLFRSGHKPRTILISASHQQVPPCRLSPSVFDFPYSEWFASFYSPAYCFAPAPCGSGLNWVEPVVRLKCGHGLRDNNQKPTIDWEFSAISSRLR